MKRIKPSSKKEVLLESGIVLTDSQAEKMEDDNFQQRIEAYAKDYHFDWYIETAGNIRICVISTVVPQVNDDIMHQLDIAHTNFMSFIDKLEPENNDDVIAPGEEEEGVVNDEVEFVKQLLNNIDDIRGAFTARIGVPKPLIPIINDTISHDCFKHMLTAYLEKYDINA